MKKNKTKKIEEIRIAGNTDDCPIATMGLNIGHLFLKYMGDYSMGNEVNILGIQFSYIDLMDGSVEISFNHNNTYNLYYMHCEISKQHFYNLEDFEKLEFTCKCIYLSLLEWAKKFNLPMEPIHDANKKIIETEYYVEKKKKYVSKGRKYTCGIEYRNEFNLQTYRLLLLDNKTEEISCYFVCQKKYFRDDELMKNNFDKWLKIPRDLKVTGWNNETEFEMKWGEEKYIFDVNVKEVKIIR